MSDEISDRRRACWCFIKIVRALSVQICEDRRVCVIGVDVLYKPVGVARHFPCVRDALLYVLIRALYCARLQCAWCRTRIREDKPKCRRFFFWRITGILTYYIRRYLAAIFYHTEFGFELSYWNPEDSKRGVRPPILDPAKHLWLKLDFFHPTVYCKIEVLNAPYFYLQVQTQVLGQRPPQGIRLFFIFQSLRVWDFTKI